MCRYRGRVVLQLHEEVHERRGGHHGLHIAVGRGRHVHAVGHGPVRGGGHGRGHRHCETARSVRGTPHARAPPTPPLRDSTLGRTPGHPQSPDSAPPARAAQGVPRGFRARGPAPAASHLDSPGPLPPAAQPSVARAAPPPAAGVAPGPVLPTAAGLGLLPSAGPGGAAGAAGAGSGSALPLMVPGTSLRSAPARSKPHYWPCGPSAPPLTGPLAVPGPRPAPWIPPANAHRPARPLAEARAQTKAAGGASNVYWPRPWLQLRGVPLSGPGVRPRYPARCLAPVSWSARP